MDIIGTIRADMPGEPRCPIHWREGRLWCQLPDGEDEEVGDGECARDAAPELAERMYGGQPCWGYKPEE